MSTPADNLYYKRSRFSSRLPRDRRYTSSHAWLLETEPGVWRVGFTKFATRMLGDIVEHGFTVKPNESVSVGQAIGWVEGFKALTDLYCVIDGAFGGPNPALEADSTLADSDPYGAGWLYWVRGTPDPAATDVDGYASLLDLTIDKMREKTERGETGE